MRVLVVEDDPAMARVIERMLRGPGNNIYITKLGEEGIELGKLYDYDIIMLDMKLPDVSGFEVLRRLRAAKVETPVLIVSGLGETQNKIDGFDLGAADYVTKPFQKEELLARINAIVRRVKGHADSLIEIGPLTVNLDTKTVEVDGKAVRLTGTEYAMVELLALRKGTMVTKEMFLDHLYGENGEAEPKVVDGFMYKIRKKLIEATGGDDYIETAWGRGYTLRAPSEAEGAADDTDENERDRVAALRSYGILDTEPEPAFDRFTRMAADTFGVPIALISLVDEKRQWFKSHQGLDLTETPRETSFCKYAIRQSDIMVVPDATKDPRFANNPLVTGSPGVRFYAGIPLSSPEGHKIGTLCILDMKPRKFSEREQKMLADFGALVMQELKAKLPSRAG